MMTRLARVVLVATRTDIELDPITIDLHLDDAERVSQKFPTSGWWGKLRGTDDLMPFIFFPSGKMDFGTGWEESSRYATTNIQTKRVDVGEYVTVTDEWGEHCFQVKQLLWADELQAAA